jgi:hypothetical protein
MLVCALNFGAARKNVSVWVCALNFGTTQKNSGFLVRALNFGAARKNVGVRVRALNLALRSVHTHKKCARVDIHKNGARGVRRIGIAQRSLVCARAI